MQEPQLGAASQRNKINLSLFPALSNKPGYKRRRSSDSGFHSPSEVSGSSSLVAPSHDHNPPSEQARSPIPLAFVSQTAPADRRRQKSTSPSSEISAPDRDQSVIDVPIIQVEPIESITDQEVVHEQTEEEGETEGESEPERLVHIKPPKSWCKRIQYVLFFPIIVLLFFTLPDVTKPVSFLTQIDTYSFTLYKTAV